MKNIYEIGSSSRLILRRGDITTWAGDAIVNAANERMLGGGGVDGAIHRSAGPTLRAECERIPEVAPGIRCPTGQARITSAGEGDLCVQYVIHTVGPVYEGDETSAPLLMQSYSNVLKLVKEHGLHQVAFPAISCGVFGYPIEKAAEIAIAACVRHAGEGRDISFVLFNDTALNTWCETAQRILGFQK